LQKEYEEKLKKMRPEGGAAVKELGVGKGGKLGATGGTLLTQYILRTQVDPTLWDIFGCDECE